MKIFVAGGTGAIGRPLIAELLSKGHALVALTRSPEKARALAEQGIEPAIRFCTLNADEGVEWNTSHVHINGPRCLCAVTASGTIAQWSQMR